MGEHLLSFKPKSFNFIVPKCMSFSSVNSVVIFCALVAWVHHDASLVIMTIQVMVLLLVANIPVEERCRFLSM